MINWDPFVSISSCLNQNHKQWNQLKKTTFFCESLLLGVQDKILYCGIILAEILHLSTIKSEASTPDLRYLVAPLITLLSFAGRVFLPTDNIIKFRPLCSQRECMGVCMTGFELVIGCDIQQKPGYIDAQ